MVLVPDYPPGSIEAPPIKPPVPAGEGNYPPIRIWKPKHEMIVHLWFASMPQAAIAEKLGCSQQLVSRVLQDPKAKRILAALHERVLKKIEEDISAELLDAAKDASKNIKQTLEKDGMALGLDFKKHQDRISIEVLKGKGFLPGSEEKSLATRPSLDGPLAERLVAALEASNEAARLHQEEPMEAEIVSEDESDDNPGSFQIVKVEDD